MGAAMWAEWLEDSMCQDKAQIIGEQLSMDDREPHKPKVHIQQLLSYSPQLERDAVEESLNIPPLHRLVDSNVISGNNVQISKGRRSDAWVSH